MHPFSDDDDLAAASSSDESDDPEVLELREREQIVERYDKVNACLSVCHIACVRI